MEVPSGDNNSIIEQQAFTKQDIWLSILYRACRWRACRQHQEGATHVFLLAPVSSYSEARIGIRQCSMICGC